MNEAAGVVVLLMALILRSALSWQTSISESKTYFYECQQHHHRPLAILRADSIGRELEIFAEDPTWPHEVRRARLRWVSNLWVQDKRADPGRGSRRLTEFFKSYRRLHVVAFSKVC